MSVSSTAVKIQYTANGVASTFTFPYYFISAIDLVVKLDGALQHLGADYTIESIGLTFSLGGRVIFGSVPALNQQVTIIRDVPETQETDYANMSSFQADVFEHDLDKRALVEQQLAEELGRAIVFPNTEVPVRTVLPVASERAGQAIMFDMAGDMIAGGILSYSASSWAQMLLDDINASAGLSTLGFSAWAKTLIDDVDGPAAQTTLGISAFIKTLLDDADADAARVTIGLPNKVKDTAADYVVLDGDGYSAILVTTGAAAKTITLPTLADNQRRLITIHKLDSASGEVLVDGEGTETINGFGSLYIGLQYQHITVYGAPTEWKVIDGIFQPVAGEPSLGTWHPTSYANRSATAFVNGTVVAANTWSNAVTMPAVPAGARVAKCQVLRNVQTNPDWILFE